MKLERLPLFEIFNSLRQRHGFPLGIEEYLIVVRSLQGGFGLHSRMDLEQLCCTLWSKSLAESRVIHKLFEQMWVRLEDNHKTRLTDNSQHDGTLDSQEEIEHKSDPKDGGAEHNRTKDIQSERPSDTTATPQLGESPAVSIEADEPVQVAKAIRNRQQDSYLKRPRYGLLNDYFPVTKRQMKQSWRYLRRLVREGVPTELDVEQTATKMEREGFLLEPVLIPPRINRTDLVLKIDREGSMVPFHALSRQLLETATRGGRLRQTSVYYFHNYVDEYVYQHPALIDALHLDEMLAETGERAAVLIISDAGAARGGFNKVRVEQSQEWIEQLQKSVKYVAWLNPMPRESWGDTTAGEIARMLPMFEMSRTGMNAAISVLRGRHVVGDIGNG